MIRHVHDYGAIILLDERFRNKGQQQQLSKWVRQHCTTYPHFGAALASVAQFFVAKEVSSMV